MGALGYVMHVPEEENSSIRKKNWKRCWLDILEAGLPRRSCLIR
jgi:FtsH_fam: ATP-dependent metallopeptidase HflB